MIKIDIDKKTLSQLLEYHANYVANTIPQNWNTIVGKTVDNTKVTQAELDCIHRALICHMPKISLNNANSNTYPNAGLINLLSQYVVQLCTTQNLAAHAIPSTTLFPKKTDRYVNILLKIIGYDNFNKGDTARIYNKGTPWNRHIFIQKLQVTVCPYCNRQYITSFHKNNHRVTTADIDHYYPKFQYPLLSMSFFNMIPSCSICNSRLKGKKKFEKGKMHLNPFFDDTDSLIFTVDNDSLESLYNFPNAETRISVEINRNKEKSNQERAAHSKSTFYLPSLYKAHVRDVENLKENMNRFSEAYFKNTFLKNYKGLFNDYEELKQVIFHFNYIDDGDEPLTKLKKDIYNQLSLYTDEKDSSPIPE